MDFTGRSSQPQQPASTGPQYTGGASSAPNNNKKNSSKSGKRGKLAKVGAGLLGLLVVALLLSVVFAIGIGGPKREASFVDSDRMQAVFLQTGQVYFGDIETMNSKFFVLKNIYYLQTSNSGSTTTTTAANTNVSLVKLGCELHAPYDQMVINRDQVTFWENLQADGQVAKAVATFQKENPNGQKCADQSAAPNSNSGVQGTSNTTSTPSTTKPTN